MKMIFARPTTPCFALPGAVVLTALLLLASVPALAADSPDLAGQVIHEGVFPVSQLSWDQDARGGFQPLLPGTRLLDQPGLPQLVGQDLLLLVPADLEVADAWIEPLATHLEKSPGALADGQPLVTDTGEIIHAARMKSADGVFPAAWGEFKGTHTWRGYRILTVGVYPLRQSGEQLEFLDSYAVRVRYAGPADQDRTARRERFVAGEAADNESILRDLVANPDRLAGYQREQGQLVVEAEGGFSPSKTPSLSGSPVDYVIVTNEAMAPEFQRLADHKTAQGLNTVVVSREFIAANFRNGADIQETVRMFLRDAYQKWGTQYVLLGGDTDVLPARYVSNSFYPATGATDIPVDLYFACLDGNWNANANAFFGEPALAPDPGDDVDFAEEVYLGRATVSNAAMAAVFVDKTIAYENTAAGSLWPNRVIYAAEVLFPAEYEEGMNIFQDGAQYVNQMVNDLVEPCTDMDYLRMYETDALFPRDLPLTKATLVDSLDTGHYGIFNQIGHGFYFNMSVGNGNFMSTDADGLVNGDHTFMLFSLNCASCAFDYSCLMERFLQNPSGGSIISIGSSRAAFPNTSNNYQQEFFEHLFCNGENRVGRLVALSRLPWLANTQYNYVDRWTFENYTLLGDPSLPLWTGVPAQLAVDAPALQLGPNLLTVQVTSGGMPVEGAIICLARAGEDHAVATTDAAGQAQIEYLAAAEGAVPLTVTGKNLALTTLAVPVLDGAGFLGLTGLVVQDDGLMASDGNGNGVAEAGERVAFWPLLLETGGSAAVNPAGTLACADPRVIIANPTVPFPSVSAGGTAASSEPVVVTFDAGIPDGTPLHFTMSVAVSGGATYLSEHTLVLKAPEVEVVSLDWEDATFGNGDGWLDSNERVNVTVRARNFGAGRSDLITAVLRTDNANVVLFDTLATFGAMELMDEAQGSALFSLKLLDNVRRSESYLILVDNHGRTYRHDFYLQRPEPTDLIETDSSLGADVIVLRWAPSISNDVLGYDVYRSQSASGPFVKVNRDVVAGVAYYRDEGLELLTRYYYRIATVDESLVPSVPSVVVQQATAPAELPGFPVAFTNETSSHLAVGDVDGDGDQEIVLASDELYVWHHDGSELLDGDNDSQSLGPFTDNDSDLAPAGIALAHLDDKPGLEMVVSELGLTQRIVVYCRDGSILPGWPQSITAAAGTDWNWATPAVGDVDGDGSPEIVVNGLNGVIWVWHSDGTELLDGDNNPATNGIFNIRPEATWEWGHSSPALCDLDGDGAKDIIFGCKIADPSGLRRLMALRHDGTNVPGFPYLANNAIDNSPAVGDLNGDGVMEIVFYDWSRRVHVVQEDGTSYPGFPVYFTIGSNMSPGPSVALGDLDDDGQLEILFAVNITGDLSTLLAFDTDVAGGTSGQLLSGWPVSVPGSSEGSPVLGDIDGDGSPDVLYGIGGGSEDAPNNLYAFHADGAPIDGFPITLNGPLMPSPVICDLDHDQDVDIVYGGWDRLVHVWDMPFAYDRRNVPWPTFHGNMLRDGVFFPIELVGVEDQEQVVPTALQVDAPYPNPFNPSTTVRFYVPGADGVELDLAVYDLQGRRVRVLHQGPIAAGWHTAVWDGRNDRGQGSASGLYFLRARSSHDQTIRKMTLVK